MELVAKISKGSVMDQVYIPKNRVGFSRGSYVIIKPLEGKKQAEKPYFYNIKRIEPVKLGIISKIMNIVDKFFDDYENIIITGSFLEQGFNFNDIDIIIISQNKSNVGYIENEIKMEMGIKAHIILLSNKTLLEGLAADPLYQMMLSKCIAKKRFIYKIKNKINYKILDLQLLKSKNLIDNFDLLSGDEKYYLARNMIAIYLFFERKKIGKEEVDKKMIGLFGLKNIKEIKQNMLDKEKFLKIYKNIYEKIFDKIMVSIKNGPKQE